MRSKSILRHLTPCLALLAPALLPAIAAADGTCQAASGKTRPQVVELYTSEGCSSCPPADRWLSTLAGRDDVLAEAFHVDYWDYIGWKDRFASPAYTERQQQLRAVSGARFVYTPQIVVDGVDRAEPSRGRLPAKVEATLTREGSNYAAVVTPLAQAPSRLAAYWTLTESGHGSEVKAGENAGSRLRHDFVVREYRPVAGWAAQAGSAQRLAFTPADAGDPAHPRQVNLVVIDAANGRPVQAVRLGC